VSSPSLDRFYTTETFIGFSVERVEFDFTRMKTTVDLPDELLAEAKAMALLRRMSLTALFTLTLERELRRPAAESSSHRFRVDESGWPVLQTASNDATIVPDALVDDLRAAAEA